MFDPIKASENIREEFIDYIVTKHSFSDEALREQFHDELEKNIAKGPYLEISDVFKTGASIDELIGEGVLSALFRELEAQKPRGTACKWPLERKLYRHQERAIRSAVAGENVVVSTGTGSGKTNCFLIPVIDELLREKESDTLGPGVRALIIYPMNALANDQMKNIRGLLMSYPDITFGVYNGETEHDEKDAIALYEAMFCREKTEELRHRLPNEVLSREKMKESPPNILITNYAMLEHLLLRPRDDVLFKNADFRFVVLDEAHTYCGATGIETAFLIRRLKARISSKKGPQFILTSATLGTEKKSDDDIVAFAGDLCGVPFKKENIIRAERVAFVPNRDAVAYDERLYVELADESNSVRQVLDSHSLTLSGNQTDENGMIYDFLLTSDLYSRLRLNAPPVCELSQIAKMLNVREETAVAFIALCTRAQKGGKLLLNARYHFFVRGLEGCYVALSPKEKLFFERKQQYSENGETYHVVEAAICDSCGKISFVGKTEDRKFKQSSKQMEAVDFLYIPDVSTGEDDMLADEELIEDGQIDKEEYFLLCPHCGAIAPSKQIAPPCDCGKGDYLKVEKAKKTKGGKARCGNCCNGFYERFYLGNDAATGVLATSLYEELPELEYVETKEKVAKSSLFSVSGSKNRKSQRRIRQFLAFSDSRQEAARFACYLDKSYKEFLRRRGIWHIVESKKEDMISQQYTIPDMVTLLTSYFSSKKSFAKTTDSSENLTVESQKQAWVAMLNELVREGKSTSLTALGLIQFEYMGNSPDIVENVAEAYNVKASSVKSLLELLIGEIVKTGAVYTGNDSDIDDNDREYIFYAPSQKYVVYEKNPSKTQPNVIGFAPKEKKNKRGEFFRTNKLDYVCRALNISVKEGADFLEQYFEYLKDSENQYCMADLKKDGTYVLEAQNFRVRVKGDGEIHWFRCRRCGRIFVHDVDGKCLFARCGGILAEVGPVELSEQNHFANLYKSENMLPLLIKEHTAQLSKKESAEYQEQFIRKEINALSCSTTFEMGVDVGDLEAVFLRDVPPLPSNYSQRAGRAGRSANAAAFALTYAKISSHDLSFFKTPEKMISGTIMPPKFKIDNEKIARRHVFAVALSMFFAENENMYCSNDAEAFINQKGYLKFIDWIQSKPERLKEMLCASIPDVNRLRERLGIEDFSWVGLFWGKEGAFQQLIDEYESNLKEFERQIKELKKSDLQAASRCESRMKRYKSNRLIDFLARGNILPRYGFPVDTVELYQNNLSKKSEKLRLSRDLQLAIGEYAPSSEVIANGRMYTSRYIRKTGIATKDRGWLIAYVGTCDNPDCGATNYSITGPASKTKCISCGKSLGKTCFKESIEPRSGFMAESKDKDVPLTKPVRNYRTDVYYIGDTAANLIKRCVFSFNGLRVQIESTTNDSLLVQSRKNFYVCQSCGHSFAQDETIGDKQAEKEMRSGALFITTKKPHKNTFDHDCTNKALNRYSLHHVIKTDVAKISFECDTSDQWTMISVAYAIMNVMANNLNIEGRDIAVCLERKIRENRRFVHSIVVYDAVPGGAGHAHRLMTEDGKMLYEIFMTALQDMRNCNCDPSCYNCLRSYRNQEIHDKLNRHAAANFLQQFEGEISVAEDDTPIV